MKIRIDDRKRSKIDPMIYGQFIEHFHRQIYGGVYDPKSSFSDEDGFRTDVLEAMRKIKVPILRWPGGCFVSAYHWKNGVGKDRKPMFDKAWRVEEPNEFGTDEYIKMCRKVGCEPYICTNAGTGTAEEMSDWVEYCNLKECGSYSRERRDNGYPEPHNVRYWSIGNENYGTWEIGAKSPEEWGRLVLESAKMMKRVDPSVELSAAALSDMEWNSNLLKMAGERLSWISIHGYWDFHQGKNKLESYEDCMKYTENLDVPVKKVKGLLEVLGLHHIKIAYDEWNLRAWYHPNIMDIYQGKTPEEYLYPRNDNDINAQYTMADAVFSACFLNMCIRNSDVVGMANFSPVVNTRGMIYTYEGGIVLRSTYHVFDLYVNHMENNYVEVSELLNDGTFGEVFGKGDIDAAAAVSDDGKTLTIALVNKNAEAEKTVSFDIKADTLAAAPVLLTVNGPEKDSYNDVSHSDVMIRDNSGNLTFFGKDAISVNLEAHSVNVLKINLK